MSAAAVPLTGAYIYVLPPAPPVGQIDGGNHIDGEGDGAVNPGQSKDHMALDTKRGVENGLIVLLRISLNWFQCVRTVPHVMDSPQPR